MKHFGEKKFFVCGSLFITKAPPRLFGIDIAHALQVGSFWDAARTQAGGHTGFVILPAKRTEPLTILVGLYVRATMQTTAVISRRLIITLSEHPMWR